MGKVVFIKKSRKEHTCGKCRQLIPVGSSYFKGEINFNPDIIRCTSCKLESWEVTTSDYQLQVGEIVYHWENNYDKSEAGAEEIASALEEIRDDLQDRLDNMPEQLQYSETGEILQNRIDCLDSAIDELGSISEDDLKDEVLNEYEPDEEVEDDSEIEWDDENEEMMEALEEKIAEAIDSALEEIEI